MSSANDSLTVVSRQRGLSISQQTSASASTLCSNVPSELAVASVNIKSRADVTGTFQSIGLNSASDSDARDPPEVAVDDAISHHQSITSLSLDHRLDAAVESDDDETTEADSEAAASAAAAAAAKAAAYETGWSDLTPNQILAVFLSLSIGQMLVAMDQSMIAVAIPNIVDQLGYPEMQSWLISGYILTNGKTTPFSCCLSCHVIIFSES